MTRRTPEEVEQAFREYVKDQGGTVTGVWQGSGWRIEVRCKAGHRCTPRPDQVMYSRASLCPTCRGRTGSRWKQVEKIPVKHTRRLHVTTREAEKNFRRALEAKGAALLDPWAGSQATYRVRCSEGHDVFVRSSTLQQCRPLCKTCAGWPDDPKEHRR